MANKTLPDLIEAVVEHYLWDLHTCIPAKVISVDYAKQKASVQPMIKDRDKDAGFTSKGLQDQAIINGVPLVFPSANTGILSFPIKAGDIVALYFTERSIDNWVGSDGANSVDPDDFRKHNYNDAIAVVGLTTFKKALGIHPTDTVLRFNANTANENKVVLKANGDVEITSPTKHILNATNEVIINTQVANINASDHVTIDSPQTTLKGELRVDGGVSVGNDVVTDAGISHNNHLHIGNLGRPTGKPLP